MKNLKYWRLFLFVFLLSFLTLFQNALAKDLSFENDKLKLVLETQETDDRLLLLAIFDLKDDWHISWQNPGDAGVATEFYLDQHEIKPINQSVPTRFLYQNLLEQYGYEHKAYYLFEFAKTSLPAVFDVLWTACRDYCEPENASFKLTFQSTAGFDQQYDVALSTFPPQLEEPVNSRLKGHKLILNVNKALDESAYFIPSEQGLYFADSPQTVRFFKNATRITILADDIQTMPKSGLILQDSGKAYQVRLINESKSVLSLLFLAFLGGLILNLMPCVFPVLSLKALNMAQSAPKKDGHIKNAFFYMLGVLTCFSLFAGLLYAFKVAGQAMGWGFQLQSPIFVTVMIVIFLVILLYLLDILTFRLPFLNAFAKASSLHSFLTGFFAVLIASPCTGPFMGAALGYALLESSHAYLPIFLSLGFGYALPLTLLELYPKFLLKVMPKPGKWMQKLKLFLSISRNRH